MTAVGFVGLGVMGFPMAGYLAKAGHSVRVFNRSPDKVTAWLDRYSGILCHSPAEAAKEAEFVFLCVGDDPDVREVVLGKGGVLDGAGAGTIIVDHTTDSAQLARELEETAQRRDCGFLDAPVSGGQAGAEAGQLTIMVGGEEATFGKALPLMECYGRRVGRMGPAGSGQLAKMVNQICIAGLLQGLSEGLQFAENAGLDVAMVVDVISQGAAQSWQMDNRWQTMMEGKFDFGFAVDWMRKDLRICKDEAKNNGSILPVAELVDQMYGEIQAAGGGRWDTSSLIKRLPKRGR